MNTNEIPEIKVAGLPDAMRRLHRIELPETCKSRAALPWVETIWHEMLGHGQWVSLDEITRRLRREMPAGHGCKDPREALLKISRLGWFDSRNPEQLDVKSAVRLEFRAQLAPRAATQAEQKNMDQFAGLVRAGSIFQLAAAVGGRHVRC